MAVRVLLIAIALTLSACGDGSSVALSGPVSEYGLGVGECFDDPPDFEYDASAIIGTPCSQPHDNEIYAIGTATGSYPGEIELNELADDFCLAEFDGFIGLSW
ncbi:MAG: hypothetical protein KJP12_05560, partial [Acidimicrobiia bacterium]|nr:hypothetical protein [Acidimicrobiia bacterium]